MYIALNERNKHVQQKPEIKQNIKQKPLNQWNKWK